jgi:hypothetical protein
VPVVSQRHGTPRRKHNQQRQQRRRCELDDDTRRVYDGLLECRCCAAAGAFRTPAEAHDAGWDVWPYFTVVQPLCPACLSSLVMAGHPAPVRPLRPALRLTGENLADLAHPDGITAGPEERTWTRCCSTSPEATARRGSQT